MHYRPEIDGLRAMAVVPVMLFHAKYPMFGGGFLGVDVFFVISGYLITSTILLDLQRGRFSLLNFYERRARRILPALLFVSAAITPFVCLWTMPDECKNFGQSLLATATFSNNILLILTTDYWSLPAEFKPLLHTWSLGVEEQYYALFPLLMILGWICFRRRIVPVLGIIAVASLIAAVWGTARFPLVAFYSLPTRAWEILLGALVAYRLIDREDAGTPAMNQTLSLAGIVLILWSILVFDQNYPTPALTTLAPTIGTVLVIVFAAKGTLVHRALGSRAMVGVGLISYSLYLWHHPLFALARIYSIDPPSPTVYAALIALSFPLAYLTWRFIETPFRNRSVVSRRAVAYGSLLGSAAAIAFGFYLNASYGMAWRVFDAQTDIEDMDKRIYNERAFRFKTGSFQAAAKLKVLIIGNSFGRDFVNMTAETFDMNNVALVYRDDLSACIFPYKGALSNTLFGSADIIVFASRYNKRCLQDDIRYAREHDKQIFYVGPKDFGYNLNWIVRLPPERRGNLNNPLPQAVAAADRTMSLEIPAERFISLLASVAKDGRIAITDDRGRMLSTDRVHVTKFGALFFGERALAGSRYGALLRRAGGT